MDGAANAQGSGAGMILTSPDETDVEYALRFDFQASNNEVEYEAVIAGLNLAHSMEADQLEVSSDSHLEVKQIEDSYEARGEKISYISRRRENCLKSSYEFKSTMFQEQRILELMPWPNWPQLHKKT